MTSETTVVPPESATAPLISTQGREVGWTRKLRWAVAGIVVAGGATLTLGSHYVEGLRPCHPVLEEAASPEEGAPTEVAEVREVCEPLGPESWALPLLFAGLLLLPDLGELSVAGLITLKNRVAQQDAVIGDTRAELSRLTSQVASLQIALTSASALAAASASSNFTINVGDAIRERLETLPEKERVALESGVSVPERPSADRGEDQPAGGGKTDDVPREVADTSSLSSRFLSLADRIAQARDHPSKLPGGEADIDRIRRWSVLYAEEIELVLRVRDALRGGRVSVGADEVFDAYRLATRVLGILTRVDS